MAMFRCARNACKCHALSDKRWRNCWRLQPITITDVTRKLFRCQSSWLPSSFDFVVVHARAEERHANAEDYVKEKHMCKMSPVWVCMKWPVGKDVAPYTKRWSPWGLSDLSVWWILSRRRIERQCDSSGVTKDGNWPSVNRGIYWW